jgi:cytochrome c
MSTRVLAAILIACFLSMWGRAAATVLDGDAQRGEQLFQKRCGGCHSLDKNKEGPQLRHVYGRKAGSVPNFQYSKALKSAGITWDDTSLDKWLTNTDSVAPDNDMAFHVPKADERADIIRYLKMLSEK